MIIPPDLTERQQRVLAYIIEYQQSQGMAPTVREICRHFGLSAPAGIHRILNVLKEKGCLLSDPGKKRSWRFAGPLPGSGIPVIGDIAAGTPMEAIAVGGEELVVSPALFGSDRCFGLRVQGDSMIEAHIMDGDIAVIRPRKQVKNGEIFAVMVQARVMALNTLSFRSGIRPNFNSTAAPEAKRSESLGVFAH